MAGRKRQKPHKFLHYIADTIKQRLNELGITRYRFVMDNSDIISHPGLSKLINAKQGYSVMVLHDVLERLDMDVKIEKKDRPQEESLTIEQTTKLYELGFDTEGILYPTAGDLMRWLPKGIDFEQDFFVSYDSVDSEWVAGYQNTDNCYSSDRLVDALYQLLLWVIDENTTVVK